jgi:hypothetical protein
MAEEQRAEKTEPVPSPSLARLAAALGWETVPVITEEQRRLADEKLAAACAEAERVYGTKKQTTR